MAFDRGDRTYYVNDERLLAFQALPTEAKLRWVEELATFIRLTRAADHFGAETRLADSHAASPLPGATS
ncbi:MAG: hypothetical protein M1449_04045 [Candidatus Thermoplasmatota archaeon]|nr:hypothetical protein [Candidatus Thermoplasmatota archaeon]